MRMSEQGMGWALTGRGSNGHSHAMPADDDGKWISLAEAAERLSVSPVTVRRPIALGRLPGYRVGGRRSRLLRLVLADGDALLVPIPTCECDEVGWASV